MGKTQWVREDGEREQAMSVVDSVRPATLRVAENDAARGVRGRRLALLPLREVFRVPPELRESRRMALYLDSDR